MKLYAISGNAGYTVKPFADDNCGWAEADFIISVNPNGTVYMAKNRRSGHLTDFLTINTALNYMQEYYDFSSEGVDVSNIAFFDLGFGNYNIRKHKIHQHRIHMNRNIKYNDISSYMDETYLNIMESNKKS